LFQVHVAEGYIRHKMCMKHYHGHLRRHSSVQISDSKGNFCTFQWCSHESLCSFIWLHEKTFKRREARNGESRQCEMVISRKNYNDNMYCDV